MSKFTKKELDSIKNSKKGTISVTKLAWLDYKKDKTKNKKARRESED